MMVTERKVAFRILRAKAKAVGAISNWSVSSSECFTALTALNSSKLDRQLFACSRGDQGYVKGCRSTALRSGYVTT